MTKTDKIKKRISENDATIAELLDLIEKQYDLNDIQNLINECEENVQKANKIKMVFYDKDNSKKITLSQKNALLHKKYTYMKIKQKLKKYSNSLQDELEKKLLEQNQLLK